ncbi:SDR family oxidoreductase [Paroceanicella profunda]|uniref:SDR family oxidoreductase n=1 Tax=Paroceanicella profunda TaxID=2579971 RepID=UPI001EEF99F8|nr:SDR family oxidoreductase [Paroceanicella profunda]
MCATTRGKAGLENGKTALVTGGSGGIGGSIAKRLASDGFQVAVQYCGASEAADKVVAEIAAAGGAAFSIRADVSQEVEVAEMFDTVMARGTCDVVVHSAGMMELAPISANALDGFDRTIATNLRGTYLAMCAAAEHMPKSGRFIALSTSVIGVNFPRYGAYIASKLGVEGLVRVFANEMRGRGISVNAVAPGPVATPLFLQGKSQEEIDRLAALPPLERLGTPEDIAAVVSFLAGPDGGWVNGQVLRANGGFA